MSPQIRHLLLAVLTAMGSALVTYVTANQGEIVGTVPVAYQAVATVVIGALLAVFTPLVKSYGVGSKPSDFDGEGIGE